MLDGLGFVAGFLLLSVGAALVYESFSDTSATSLLLAGAVFFSTGVLMLFLIMRSRWRRLGGDEASPPEMSVDPTGKSVPDSLSAKPPG